MLQPTVRLPQITSQCHDLRDKGYCVLPQALPPAIIAAIDADLSSRFEATPFGSGGFYGEMTKRFGRLLIHSRHARELVSHPFVLAIAETILAPFCDHIQLNTTQAIAVFPNAPEQLPHRDQDMWPAPKGETEFLINVMWPLVPFRAENGATRLWPGSHGKAALDPGPAVQPVVPALEPGDALIFLGSTLHAAGANRSAAVRRGIIVGYSLGWLKPYENQMLGYPPHLARDFPPDLAALVGYRQHRPNLGNYEGQCPSVLLENGADPDAPRGAIDALRPDQAALVAALTGATAPANDRAEDPPAQASQDRNA